MPHGHLVGQWDLSSPQVGAKERMDAGQSSWLLGLAGRGGFRGMGAVGSQGRPGQSEDDNLACCFCSMLSTLAPREDTQ